MKSDYCYSCDKQGKNTCIEDFYRRESGITGCRSFVPRSCDQCPMREYSWIHATNSQCILNGKQVSRNWKERPNWCTGFKNI